ncbi:MAG: sigma-70 family RNA polymerase sigma factor [Prolixibacteraceae bacterium]
MSKLEDRQIWENTRNGSRAALKALHDKYFNQMCLYALKSVSESGAVEELVSDCFIKIWENRDRIEIKTSVKHYIFLMLRNNVIDFHRKRKILTEQVEKVQEPPDEEIFDDQEAYAKLYSLLEKLPLQRRTILELAVFDALSYKEIAERLKLSKNTVKTQIGRAYRFLKEHLDPGDFYLFFIFHCYRDK